MVQMLSRKRLDKSPSTGELTIVNPSCNSTAEKTVVVFGCGRGGTSALSGCLRNLGVAMAEERVHPLKHEWSPVEYVNNNVDRRSTKLNIDFMDARYPVWGWKAPKDLFALSQYVTQLRNPHIIIVFRNVLDVCRSSELREGVPAIITLLDACSVYSALADIAASTEFPLAMVSYESLVKHADAVAKNLNEWLALNASPQALLNAASFVSGEGGYRPIEGEVHDGLFDQFELEKDKWSQQINAYSSFLSRLEQSRHAVEEDLRNAKDCRSWIMGELAARAEQWCGDDKALYQYIMSLEFSRDEDRRKAFHTKRNTSEQTVVENETLDSMREQSELLQKEFGALRGHISTMLMERRNLQREMDGAQDSLDLLSSLAERGIQPDSDEFRRMTARHSEDMDGGKE